MVNPYNILREERKKETQQAISWNNLTDFPFYVEIYKHYTEIYERTEVSLCLQVYI